jgi:hypothetical protein
MAMMQAVFWKRNIAPSVVDVPHRPEAKKINSSA